jgi:hypothetical protein
MSGRLARAHPGLETVESPISYRQEVAETELPSTVRRLSAEYDRLVGHRDEFLWKWIHNLFDSFTLSSVPGDRRETVKEQKTVLTMFVTLADDVADNWGDPATFEAIRHVPHDSSYVADGADEEVVGFAETLWEAFESRLVEAPRYDEFVEVFEFDVRQVVAAMEYGYVLNENRCMANLEGSRHYGQHNMVMFPYADVDVMHSPGFDHDELGTLRTLLWEVQPMARIGNWVTTWERELREDDCTAGVVVDAIERGLLPPETDLDDPESRDAAVRAIREEALDDELRREWDRRHASVASRDWDLDTVDPDHLLRGMEEVMRHHVASAGLK